jgi:hypothetical protein
MDAGQQSPDDVELALAARGFSVLLPKPIEQIYMDLGKSGKSQIRPAEPAEFTWGLGKSGKCPKLFAEPAERSFHKHSALTQSFCEHFL